MKKIFVTLLIVSSILLTGCLHQPAQYHHNYQYDSYRHHHHHHHQHYYHY